HGGDTLGLFAVGGGPDDDRLVGAAGGNVGAVGAPCHAVDGERVACQLTILLPARNSPDADELVAAAGQKLGAIGTEGRTRDLIAVGHHLGTRDGDLPKLDGSVFR